MFSKSAPSAVMTPLWLVFWAVLFSLCWLVPVHLPPWKTFSPDAWSAFSVLVIALVVVIRTRSVLIWHSLSCLVAGLVLLPWLQFFFGLLPFVGQAWISSAYLLGFLLALIIGERWELACPSQLAHGLFMAIGLAAIASVGLQLYTWLDLAGSGVMGMWSMDWSGTRPYANLGQPNQLATLLLWGVMACLWAYLHKAIGEWVAIFTTAFLLLGIALTQSRAGFLTLTVMLVAVWFWRDLWPSRLLPRVVSGLYLYILMIPSLLRWLNATLLLDQNDVYVRVTQQGELRLSAWRLFIQAVVERPWFGYGWTEVSSAQLAVADQLPVLDGIFQQSHNLFLDLVLWTGLPIGLLVTGMLIHWFWKKLRAVRRAEEAALFLLLTAVGIHALVEYPLQYAYFLLPAGLVMGILEARLGARIVGRTPHWMLSCLWVTAALVLGVTIRDYAQVASSYNLLRLEQSIVGQGRGPMGGPPDVWALTQLREWIVVARYKAHPGMSQRELTEMTVMTHVYPAVDLIYQLATALALNGQPDEARVWLRKICKVADESQCRLGQRSWEQDSRMAAIQWPK